MVGVVGFVAELYRPAVLAFIADVAAGAAGPGLRPAPLGDQHRLAFAAIVGGLLAEIDFTILFLVDAATMAIYGAIVLALVPETRPTASAPAPSTTAPAPAPPADTPPLLDPPRARGRATARSCS